MEFFPSVGVNQWIAIRDSISSADFCVFVIAGRYGSIVPGMEISWTHREFHEVVRQGKPWIALLHKNIGALPSELVDSEQTKREGLRAFRAELEANGCRYFGDDAELVTGLLTSIAALKRDNRIEGWIPAGRRPVLVQETDFAMSYDSIEIEHIVTLSPSDPDRLDTDYFVKRVVRGNRPFGVKAIAQEFSRTSDAVVFDKTNQPRVELVGGKRSGPGSMRLVPARKTTGASYVQDILFAPPIGLDEVVEVELKAHLPRYKLAFLDDVVRTGINTRLGPVNYDYAVRIVNVPIKLLTMRVFIADETGASPAGPKVGTAEPIDETERPRLVAQGC